MNRNLYSRNCRYLLLLTVLLFSKSLFAVGDTSAINALLEESKALQRTDQARSMQLANKAFTLSEKSRYDKGKAGAQLRIGSILYSNGNIDSAKKVMESALLAFKKLENPKGASSACVILSYIHEYSGNYDSAFAILYEALRLIEKEPNKVRESQIYVNLGNLFLRYGDKKKAIIQYNLAAKNSSEVNDIDGVISAWDGIGRFYIEEKNFKQALRYFEKVDSISLILNDEYSRSQNLTNIALCYESLLDYQTAKKYYTSALQLYNQLGMQSDAALGYNNLGNLFVLINKPDSAILNLNNAVQIGRRINDPQSIANSYDLLSQAYALKGDFAAAYKFHQYYSAISDSILNKEKVKQIAAMQTKFETEKKAKQIAVLDAQNKTKSAQRNIFVLGTILFLLLCIAILVGLIKTRKEKKISEDLLHNILPSEVADELKMKGSADAKYFDEVTVLFTDFKDFTQITEKLTPSELVDLLHSCFKAFDNIITAHRVEKIKTIGDSYMCAGGLPVPNKSNAIDVVRAALEIQEKMREFHANRIHLGKEGIEMRLGIHTGSVVAGIVGVKKFAYDIWGDTVNTASRMESSGIPGKVNISGATYDLVKDYFNCVHRGKIEAKHKGMIDMYIVESEIKK